MITYRRSVLFTVSMRPRKRYIERCARPTVRQEEREHAALSILATLNQRIGKLYRAAKYSEPIPLAEKSLELTRALKGEQHLETAAQTSWLASLYQAQGRQAEAEPLYKRSLQMLENGLPNDHPKVCPDPMPAPPTYQADMEETCDADTAQKYLRSGQ